MDFKVIPIQKMLLVILVLAISMMVGWYGEKAVEKFTANSGEAGQIQNI